MNASFITLGVTMMLGSLFITSEFRKSRSARIGFWLMALAGSGTVFVGIFPENSVPALHFMGALQPFLCGNVALVLFAYGLKLPTGFRWYTGVSGVLALAALVLFVLGVDAGLGQGGMERVVAYPQTIWLTFFGIYMSTNHYRNRNGGFSS